MNTNMQNIEGPDFIKKYFDDEQKAWDAFEKLTAAEEDLYSDIIEPAKQDDGRFLVEYAYAPQHELDDIFQGSLGMPVHKAEQDQSGCYVDMTGRHHLSPAVVADMCKAAYEQGKVEGQGEGWASAINQHKAGEAK